MDLGEILMLFKEMEDLLPTQQSDKNSKMLLNNPLEVGIKYHSILSNEEEVKHPQISKSQSLDQFLLLTMILEILTSVHSNNQRICRQRRD